MRNSLYPSRTARYATLEERKAVKRGDLECERVPDFIPASKRVKVEPMPLSKPELETEAWKAYLQHSGKSNASKDAKATEEARDQAASDLQIKSIEVGHLLPCKSQTEWNES